MTVLTALVERWDPGVLSALGAALTGVRLVDMAVRQASLEDAFAQVTGAAG